MNSLKGMSMKEELYNVYRMVVMGICLTVGYKLVLLVWH